MCVCSGGCLLWGGCVCSGGSALGVSAPGGGVQTPPAVNRMTDACKNITLPGLRCGR